MELLVKTGLALLLLLAVYLALREARAEQRPVEGMTDDELMDEIYSALEFGEYPNDYSREYDRRMHARGKERQCS